MATNVAISVVQINLNHCKAAMSLLASYVLINNIDLVCIQDPYTIGEDERKRVVGFPSNWSCYYSINLTSGILVTNSKFYVTVTARYDNVVIANILAEGNKFFIISQYTAPSQDLVNDLGTWCSEFYTTDCVAFGDFNAKSVNWGYRRKDDRGDKLLEICSIYDYYVLNNKFDYPTYHLADRTGYPDLTIATASFKNRITDWHVDITESGSDHRYVRSVINLNTVIIKKQLRYKIKHFSIKKFDYEARRCLKGFEVIWSNCMTNDDIDNTLDQFYKALYRVCDKVFMKKRVGGSCKLVWWSRSLRAARNKLTALFKKYKRTGMTEDKIEYNRQRALYKKQINDSKKKSWVNFCKNTDVKFGKAFNVVRDRFLNNSSLVHIRLNGMPLNSDYVEIYDKLIDTHFYTHNVVEIRDTEYEKDDNLVLGVLELKRAIKKQALNKAPGSDLIDPRITRLLFRVVPEVLEAMFNVMLQKCYFPKRWKLANVIFFTKKDKDTRDARSYRPVCLLQTMSKVFERIINNRLLYSLEKGGLLHNGQYGFREARSTLLCLHDIISDIKHRGNLYKYTALISIDFKGAFDSVGWDVVLKCLVDLDINRGITKTIQSFLTNRQVGYLAKEDWNFKYINRGCPQGSCLGPVLWNLVADKILKYFDDFDCRLIAYADDFVLIFSENSRSSLETKGNRLIENFYAFVSGLDLEISETKTKVIIFGKDLSRRNPIFKMRGINLKVVDKIKHLGVILDNKLNFLPHVEYLQSDLINFNTNLRRVGNAYWGIKKDLLRTWYDVVVEAKLTYCIQVWFPYLNSHGRLKLESVQRTCLLKILKCYRNVSNQAIFVLSGVPPLVIKARYLCKLFQLKWGTGVISFGDRIFKRDDFELRNQKNRIDPTAYPSNFRTRDELQFTNLSAVERFLQIYTDGSKGDDGVGLAFIAFDKDIIVKEFMEKLRQENSVFQAESLALTRALNFFANSGFTNLQIVTDSQSAMEALQNVCPSSPILLEFLDTCAKLTGRQV
jgi:hypothetical protein